MTHRSAKYKAEPEPVEQWHTLGGAEVGERLQTLAGGLCHAVLGVEISADAASCHNPFVRRSPTCCFISRRQKLQR